MRSTNTKDVNFFLELEIKVWSALVAGDLTADQNLLADDFLGVYGSGMAGKEEHAGQLTDGPTIAAYSLSDARIQILADNVVLLAYLARCTLVGKAGGNVPEIMYITSIWRETHGVWLNVFSQDTLAYP